MKRESPYFLLNKRFTKLIVYEILPTVKVGKKYVRKLKCKCDCGGEIITRLDSLKSGATISCGCISKQRLHEGRYKHGYHNHPLYKILKGIEQRCYNKKCPNYYLYGAKGVKVCNEWLESPVSFINWALANGWQSGLEIDKDIKAKELGILPLLYSPERCSIVTPKENTNGRSITVFLTYQNETLSISEWAIKTGIDRDLIYRRIKRNWPSEKILSRENYGKDTRFKKGFDSRRAKKIYNS